MRAAPLALLLALSFLLGAEATNKHKEKHHPHRRQHTTTKRSSEEPESPIPTSITPFVAGREYCFEYNSQVSSGYAPWISGQQASSRLQSRVCLTCVAAEQCVLRMSGAKAGQRNAEAGDWNSQDNWDQAAHILPLKAFEPLDHQDREEIRLKLDLPVEFAYVNGNVERLQFHSDDNPWSKNLKKAVLNLIQLQMTPANGQEIEDEEENGQNKYAKAFTTTEITLEGICPVSYSILASPENTTELNITKSINFQRCQKLADVGYGFQVEPTVESAWPEQKDSNSPFPTEQNTPTGLVIPKEKLARSTVIRFVLAKDQKEEENTRNYGIQRVELLSEYIMKSSQAESSQAMQTIAASELVFVECNAAGNQETGIVRDAAQNKEEALLYNADLESQEKIYYMFGDERIPYKDSLLCFKTKNSEQEIEKAEHHLQELVVAFGEKNQQKGGIESSNTIEHFEKLVHIMRLCSVEELKNLDKKANKIDSSNQQKVAADLFADALAVAATRNTITLLEKKIKEESGISEVKAVQVLKILGRGAGLPAPSDSQVDAILRLCKSDVISDSKVLKQSCWLTFGAMVGELSLQNNKAKLMKQTASPMRVDETTADHKMQLYKDVLIKQLKEAESIPEKIFALKCIGNAALEIAVPELREVIDRRSECPAVRIYAIDALRRLRHQLKPQKIHSIVMPIYMNTDEKPELRMNAFSMVMQTRPSNAIVDQIAFTMTNEKSDDVQSFVYSTMKSASQSPIPEQQIIASQLKNALKLAQINEEQLEAKHLFSYSRRWTAPFYSQQQEEGAFANFVSMFSPRDSMLPSHMSFGLDTYFNGQYNRNALRVTLCQKEIEQLIKQVFEHYQGDTTDGEQRDKPSLLNVAAQKLRSIFNKLKIRGRGRQQDKGDEYKQEDQSPYFVISIRMNDVDIGMIPLNMDYDQGTVSQMKQALVNTLRNLFSNSDMKTFQLNTAMVINSRRAVVPTSIGVSLQMHQSMYIVGQVKGSIQANSQSKVKVNFHPNANWVQVQKMEARVVTYSSGVRSSRSVAINIPLDIAFENTRSSNNQKQTKISMKVPQELTRLVAVNSLPTTYLQKVIDATSNSTNFHYYRIKAVENQQFQSQMREVNVVMGAKGLLNIPLRIHGHFETPRKIFSLKEVVKAIMVGDNHVSVDLVPNHEMSKEITATLSAEMFQPDNKSPVTSIHPKLEAFYTSVTTNNRQPNGRVQSTDDESSSEEEEEERRQPAYANQQKKKVTDYLNKYVSSQKRNYKHSLKCVVETKGTAKTNKAEFKVDGTCDARLRACEANVHAKRSALAGERNEWTMEAQAQTLYPEHVADLEELLDSSIKQHKFFCHIQADWGNTTQKERISINVLGEPSQRVLRSVQLYQQQQVNSGRRNSKRQIARRAAKMPFVDRYQIVANYRLKPANEHYFANKLECVKANNFWNTESRLMKAEGNSLTTYQSGLHQGQLEGLFTIEPETGRHANVSIQTPSQKVKITGLELPIKMRPMKLVRPHSSSAATHSASQFVSGMVNQQQARKQNRAECKVGVKTVDTFDKVALRAPISKCYTVLAKDCGDETESKFAILMRSLQTGGEQKKLKIITPSKEIVLEDQVEGRMRIRVNDKEFNMGVANSQEDHERQQVKEQNLRQHNIRLETDSQGRLVAFVDVDGADVAVKFNGKTAKIQMSEQFKEKQCGLCGNYNDDQDDELRNNENKLSSDVKAFHRSYTLDRDGGECQEDDLTNFYERQSAADFGHTQPKQVEPVDRTVIMEYNHKLCFSIKPVKQCPHGYFAGEEEEGAKQLLKRPKVSFSCLDRQSIEGQRLRKIVRRNGVADLGEYQPSFYETVVIPETCIQY